MTTKENHVFCDEQNPIIGAQNIALQAGCASAKISSLRGWGVNNVGQPSGPRAAIDWPDGSRTIVTSRR